MGVKRLIRHIPGIFLDINDEDIKDIVNNIVYEKGIANGVKKTIKEWALEDIPIVSAVYKSGKYDGKKEGYTKASKEYEKKLLDQAEKFINQQKIYEEQNEEYDSLLDEYEKIIEELINKKNKTDEENEYLKQLLEKKSKLENLAI